MRIVVVGAGMVGHRFVDDVLRRVPAAEVTVVGEEPYEPYNRVLLTDLLAGRTELSGLALTRLDTDRLTQRTGVRAVQLHRDRRIVELDDGSEVPYDALVLATGAAARIVPVPGLRDGMPRGAHVLRAIDDVRDIAAAALNAHSAVVVGAGPVGLEAACALRHRGVAVTVIDPSGVLSRNVDGPVAEVVAEQTHDLGVAIESTPLASVLTHDGRVSGVRLSDDRTVDASLLVLAAGSVPATTLASRAGLDTDHGIVVDHRLRSVSDEHVYAIGDCAQTPNGVSGLIAPGWAQARALADHLAGGDVVLPRVEGSAMRLKAVGISVVTMGDRASTAGPTDRVITVSDPAARRHAELVVRDDRLTGLTCVGAPELAAHLETQFDRSGILPADPLMLLMGAAGGGVAEVSSPTTMPATTTVCRCNGVTKRDLVAAWDAGAGSADELAAATQATTGCGSCRSLVCGIAEWLSESDPASDQAADPADVTASGRA